MKLRKLFLFFSILNLQCATYFCTPSKKPSFDQKTEFPVYENDNFTLYISATNDKLPLYSVIMLRCIIEEKIVEEHILNPGYLPALPARLNGQHFMVVNYKVKPYLVEITMQFKRESNKGHVDIFFLETDSKHLRMDVVDNPDKYSNQYKLGSLVVSLMLHWNINLVQKTLDHREGGLIADSTGILVCQASDGFPFSPVRFRGVDKLFGKQQNDASMSMNKAEIVFQAKIEHHMMKVGCEAGNDDTYDTIKIFHHPTKLVFEPDLSSGYVGNGTNIHCRPLDGYPNASVTWAWISGPKNSEEYFSLSANNSILMIDKKAPLGSKWIFKCLSWNTIPNSIKKGKSTMVSFTIGDKPVPYFLIFMILVACIVLMILIAIIVFIVRSPRFSYSKKFVNKSPTILVSNQHSMEDVSIDKALLEKTKNPIDEV